jgi:hypothetical protein
MSKESEGFKVGDKIKWKTSEYFSLSQDREDSTSSKAGINLDSILTVSNIEDFSDGMQMIYTTPDIGGWYGARFEKAQEVKKAQKPEPVFKIGDIVRMKADKPVFGRGGVSKGDIGTIKAVGDQTYEGMLHIDRSYEDLTPYADFHVDFPGQSGWWAKIEDLELVQKNKQTVKAKSLETKPDWDVPVNKASRQMAEILKNSKGSFVSVTFIKKDGTERVLSGRYKSSWENTLTMYDTQKKGYRTIHIDKILSVRANGLKISLA